MTVERLTYTVKDACAAIGLRPTRLYELIGAGSIRAVKSGGKTLIPAESIDAYIASLPPADIRTGQRRAAS